MRDKMGIATAFALITLAAVMIVFGPLASIWAVNTLFGTAIEYSFATWAAAAWIGILLNSSKVSRTGGNK